MDKILNAVKDLDSIKSFLEAINQTTDDFLFILDIPKKQFEFFGRIKEAFAVDQSPTKTRTVDEVLTTVHPADRKALVADIQKVCLGQTDSLDMNFRMFNKNGDTVWVNSRGKVMHDENGAPYLIIGRLSEEALRHLFNPLTGLWNKIKLREDLKGRLCSGKGWLMMLGIPSLADINLSHGISFGNKLLCELANILEDIECIEETYHVDNNYFAAVIGDCESEDVERVHEHICQAMSENYSVYAGVVPIDKSIFIDASRLVDCANITLRDAIQGSAGYINFFSVEDINQRINELTLLEELKESVHNDFEGFEVYYQPQIKSGSYELYGVEALLRYTSKERGRVFPDEFIPILEQSGLIDPVGMWVLNTALAQCKVWRDSIPALQVAVNFSSVQFDDIKLGDKIIYALKNVGLPGSALTVELTESIQLNQNKHYYDTIKYIKYYGVRFSIDDFGTGYSNLGYLKQLDVSEIKIDRSFVTEIEKDTYNYLLISNVIEFAKTNSIHACCEGVETVRELSILEPLQADFFQGYLFDKPCTAGEIAKKYIHVSSDEYSARMCAIDEINRFKEQFGGVHFDPRNILHANNIGLWIMRIDAKNNKYELHVDDIMERVLGLTEKLTPAECYEYWCSHVLPDDTEYVNNAFRLMVNDGKAVQMGYRWLHPSLGEVVVRSSGIRTSDENSAVVIEGYHRILTGVEGV